MKNGYDNVGSCHEALEFRSNSYKYGDYLGRFRAEVAKPGMAAVSKTAGRSPREFESPSRRHILKNMMGTLAQCLHVEGCTDKSLDGFVEYAFHLKT